MDTAFDPRWVTVYGVPPSFLDKVLNVFGRYGDIIQYKQQTDTNYINILFKEAILAQKALSRDGTFLVDRFLIGVKLFIHQEVLRAKVAENGYVDEDAVQEMENSLEREEASKMLIEVSDKSSPTANTQQSPTTNMHQAPTANMQQAPTGNMQQAPTANMPQAPTGNMQQAPTANMPQAPTGNMQQAPTGQMHQTPTTNMQQAPTAKTQQAPTTVAGATMVQCLPDGQKSHNLEELCHVAVKEEVVDAVIAQPITGLAIEELADEEVLSETDDEDLNTTGTTSCLNENEQTYECRSNSMQERATSANKSLRASQLDEVPQKKSGNRSEEMMPLQVLVSKIDAENSGMRTGGLPSKSMSTCGICQMSFDNAMDLYSHMNKNHSLDLVPGKTCTFCGESFLALDKINTHLLRAHGVKRYECDICQRMFSEERGVTQHKITHTSMRPFKCDACGKSYRWRTHLKTHKQTQHSDERPYQCSTCQKTFAYKNAFKTHLKLHSTEKEFVCDTCGKAFHQGPSLYNHIHYGCQSKEFKYLCNICGKQFRRPDAFKNHNERNHPKPTEAAGNFDNSC